MIDENIGLKNRIGLIGCGRWGKNILRDLITLNCHVFVVEKKTTERQNATDLGAKAVFEKIEYLPDVDGYIVATETINHYDVIVRLLKNNKPIFSEKPLTNTLQKTEDLLRLGSKQLFVMHKWRYHPGVEKIAEIVSSNQYGKLVHLDVERKQYGIPHKDVDASFILLPHDLSIALHIMGHLPEIKYAFGNYDANRKIHYLNINLGTNPTCKIEISDRFTKNHRMVHAQLEHSSILLDDPLSDHIQIKESNGDILLTPIDIEYPLLRELKTFLRFIKGGAAPMTTLNEEVEIMKVLTLARNAVFTN